MQPEKRLQSAVLQAVGRDPGVLVAVNHTGSGFTANARALLTRALEPWGPLAQQAAEQVLMRCRVTYGLGVGSPDLVLSVDGLAGALELKTETGRVEPHQAQWHAAARRRGLFVQVVRSPEDATAAVAAMRARAPKSPRSTP